MEDDYETLLAELEAAEGIETSPSRPWLKPPSKTPPSTKVFQDQYLQDNRSTNLLELSPVNGNGSFGRNSELGMSRLKREVSPADLESEIDGLLSGLDDDRQKERRTVPAHLTATKAQTSFSAGNRPGICCSAVFVGYAEEQGNRPAMEDRIMTQANFSPSSLASKTSGARAICAVFDGHSGSLVADYAAHRVPEMLEKEGWYKSSSVPDCNAVKKSLEKVFMHLDDEILSKTVQGVLSGGSTANIGLLLDDWLHVANLGDARAVLSRAGSASALSSDHKPDVEAERLRIEANDGKVEWRGCWRVMVSNGGNPRGLAVSRAFGDVDWKVPVVLVESKPDVRSVHLVPTDEFLVIGCDGVWDVLKNQDAVDIARKHLVGKQDANSDAATTAAAKEIACRALQAGSQDNVSVVVMKFFWS